MQYMTGKHSMVASKFSEFNSAPMKDDMKTALQKVSRVKNHLKSTNCQDEELVTTYERLVKMIGAASEDLSKYLNSTGVSR